MRKPSPEKASRVNLRVVPYQKDVITRAARIRQTTVSNFILERSYKAAQQVLADQVHFSLSEDRWRAFCTALDAPPREIPALRRLLTEPGAFDGGSAKKL
jgi:uncharacterized protein (DUF1778 family)